jgi:hypothetical protein
MANVAIALLILGVLCLFSSPALAGIFKAAESSLTIRLGVLPPLVTGGNVGGAQTSVGPVVTEFAAPTAAFGPANIDIPDSLFTGIPQISDLRFHGLGKPVSTATLATGQGFGGGFGGIAGLGGSATICIFSCAFIQVVVPAAVIGVGGQTFTTALGLPLTVSAAYGWTTGPAVITSIDTNLRSLAGNICAPVTCPVTTQASGVTLPTVVNTVTTTGTNNLTPQGGGTMSLVAPVRTNSLAGRVPLFAHQKLSFLSPLEKVTLCHVTGSAKKPVQTVEVSAMSVPAHLAHGDSLGACG